MNTFLTYWKHNLLNYVHVSTSSTRVMWNRHLDLDSAPVSNLGSSSTSVSGSDSNSVCAVKDTYAPEDRMHGIPLLRVLTLQICSDESQQRVPQSLSQNSRFIPCPQLVPLTHIYEETYRSPGLPTQPMRSIYTWDPLFITHEHANASIKMNKTR